jgi:hypothetical protein
VIITHSSCSLFHLCERRYYWRYERGLDPIEEPNYLTIGRIVHNIFQRRYGQGEEMEAVIAAIKKEEKGAEHDTLQTALFLAIAHDKKWGQFPHVRPELVEKVFCWKPARGILAKGRIDLVTEEKDGLWIVDHKITGAAIEVDYLERAGLDGQLSWYLLGFQEHTGIRPRGAFINIICRPRTYRRVDESIETYLGRCASEYEVNPFGYFHRQATTRDDRLLDEKREEIIRTAHEIRGCKRKKLWVKNDAICFLRERRCPYIPLCADGEQPRTLGLFRVKKPHSELD